MKFLIILVITLLLGVGAWYFMLNNKQGIQVQINTVQNSAQEKAATYKAEQEKMMKQLGQ